MNLRKLTIILSILVILTLCGVFFLSTLTNQEAHRAITHENLSHMSEISRGSVIAIKNEFDFIKRILKAFREKAIEYKYNYESEKAKADFLNLYKNTNFLSLNDVGYIDENGIVRCNVTAPWIIGKDISYRSYYQNIKLKNDPNYMYIEDIEFIGADKGKQGLIFALGAFDEDAQTKAPIFKGVFVITTFLNSFLERYIKPMPIGIEGYQWFFEKSGKIIYHPNIAMGTTYESIKESPLHSDSFKIAMNNIMTMKALTGTYEENGKLFVYSATFIEIGFNNNWFFVVSIPKDETDSILNRYSKTYFLLTLTALLSILFFGIFLILIFYLQSQRLKQEVDIKTSQLEYEKKCTQELDSIIHTIAHDISSPLTSIYGYSEMLGRNLKEDAKNAKASYIIHSNAIYISKLMESLLEFARAGKVKSIIEDVPLKDVFDIIKQQLHYSIEKKKATVNIPEILPIIKADKMKITQVFFNLIGNALKFVPKDRPPKIDIIWDESEEFYNISVSDNGIGIDEQNLDSIFKIFHRIKEIKVSGTGVGLAIVKKIIDDHNGKITVKSQKSVGTTFTVSIRK